MHITVIITVTIVAHAHVGRGPQGKFEAQQAAMREAMTGGAAASAQLLFTFLALDSTTAPPQPPPQQQQQLEGEWSTRRCLRHATGSSPLWRRPDGGGQHAAAAHLGDLPRLLHGRCERGKGARTREQGG
jgi:hypothetical protein